MRAFAGIALFGATVVLLQLFSEAKTDQPDELLWILAGLAVDAVLLAVLAAKRMDVRTYRHGGTEHSRRHASSRTYYYATFQVESGDRMELEVPDMEYGLLVEGDRGRLTFQGTRFQGFRRT